MRSLLPHPQCNFPFATVYMLRELGPHPLSSSAARIHPKAFAHRFEKHRHLDRLPQEGVDQRIQHAVQHGHYPKNVVQHPEGVCVGSAVQLYQQEYPGRQSTQEKHRHDKHDGFEHAQLALFPIVGRRAGAGSCGRWWGRHLWGRVLIYAIGAHTLRDGVSGVTYRK